MVGMVVLSFTSRHGHVSLAFGICFLINPVMVSAGCRICSLAFPPTLLLFFLQSSMPFLPHWLEERHWGAHSLERIEVLAW